MDDLIRSHRKWLKDSIRKTVDWNATGQSRGLPPPPAQKTVPPNARTVALPEPDRFDAVQTESNRSGSGRATVRAFVGMVFTGETPVLSERFQGGSSRLAIHSR